MLEYRFGEPFFADFSVQAFLLFFWTYADTILAVFLCQFCGSSSAYAVECLHRFPRGGDGGVDSTGGSTMGVDYLCGRTVCCGSGVVADLPHGRPRDAERIGQRERSMRKRI